MATGIAIKLLARELNISVDYLIYQLSDIGVYKTDLDYVSFQEKKILLIHMNRNQNKLSTVNKLTLQRKTLSTLNVFSSGGRSKKIQVEVRKKHTYVQCDDGSLQNRAMDNILGSVNESNVFPNAISIKENELTCDKKGLKNDLSVMSISHGGDNDLEKISYQEGDKVVVLGNLDNKNMLEKENISKNLKCNQYENKEKKTSYSLKQKKDSHKISDISSVIFNKNTSKSERNNNKKKVNNDRRFRVRQRLHSVKSRHTDKVNINVKYQKNNSFNVMKYEYDEFHAIVRGIKNKQRKTSILTHAFNKPTQVVIRDVVIGEMITVSELANKMAVKGSHVIKMIMQLGAMVTINQVIDQQTAQLVAEEMGHRVILRRENDLEEMVMNDREFTDASIVSNAVKYRAPVVTIMGHVDHGKTSLLDYIRSSKVADSEKGGITQHIGAYCVEVPYTSGLHNNDSRRMITFLDTPGHEAFTAMRSRGVQITDIVVLVVAVDDGVMLQTIEAIQHVKTSKTPLIVALNKIDKLGSFDINRIKNDLAKEGVISEEWGGGTQFVNVSAKSGIGVDNLLNAILLESELLELKTIQKTMATGVVIESFLDRGRGPVASVLVREGILRCGDVVLCGLEYGRIRSMRNESGNNIDSAGPSIPVEVFGLSGPPFAGDFMVVVRDERKAREVALYRQGKFRSVKLARRKQNTLENVLSDIGNEDNVKLLKFNIVLKADVQGSVEAISNVLKSLSSSDIKVDIIGSGVGRINETDVSLAITTRSILLGFNVQSDILARKMIELEDINVYYFSVIYDLIDGVKRLIDSMLVINDQNRKSIALAEVRDVFCLPKLGNIAGCMILEGVVRRYNKVRVLREKNIVYEGELASLRRFKDDVNEVRAGMECGISIKNYTDFCSGDFIEVFD